MPVSIEEGWTVLGRTQAGALHPCYFCSRQTPKFEVGWRVQLVDGQTITVGPDCGKSHLGDRFVIDRRAIELAEELANLQRRRTEWLSLSAPLREVAAATREHIGLQRLTAIKQETLNLGNRARHHLSAIAQGTLRGVPRYRIFEVGGPRQNAAAVVKSLDELEGCSNDRAALRTAIQALQDATANHNGSIADYSSGLAAFTAASIAAINESMPQVSWALDGRHLVMTRLHDGLSKRLPLPDGLTLDRYPTP